MRAAAFFFAKGAVGAVDAPVIVVVAELNDVARPHVGEGNGRPPHVVGIVGNATEVGGTAGASTAQRAIGEREALAVADALAVVAPRVGDDLVGHAGRRLLR